MLARLDEELAPARFETDHSGQFLRISKVTKDASRVEVVEDVRRVVSELGYEVVGASTNKLPERWYGPDQVTELSEEEAATLAAGWATEFSDRFALTKQQRHEIEEVLRDPVRRAIRRFTETQDASSLRALIEDLGEKVPGIPRGSELIKWIESKLRESV